MTKDFTLENMSIFCHVLKKAPIKDEIKKQIRGYQHDETAVMGNRYMSYFYNELDNRIFIAFEKNSIILEKFTANQYDFIFVEGVSLTLNHVTIEIRPKGFIYTDLLKQYAAPKCFDYQYVLSDLKEIRHVITKDSIELVNAVEDMRALVAVFKKRPDFLEYHSSFSTEFITQLNIPSFRIQTNNILSTTYLNGEDISNIYNMLRGKDVLYRIYDLYQGVVNAQNAEDIKSIDLGALPYDAFGLKCLIGITSKEDELVDPMAVNTLNCCINNQKYN